MHNNYTLAPPSNEQKTIIDAVASHNIIVNALAGSGKTTTILHIGTKYKHWRILVLTYNSKLKLESREKCKALKLNNMEIHSYHAFCVKYYDEECYTDKKIQDMLKANCKPVKFAYDLIVIDECQDMTPLYYELFCKIMTSHVHKPKVCALGDVNQSIFQFNNADRRFMEFGTILFDFNDYPWTNLTLSTSYRITNQMANFINSCIFRDNRMIATKNGADVKYIITDVFGDSGNSTPYNEMAAYLNEYSYEDIFVLAPSVRSVTSPIRMLANQLSDNGVPIYVPNNDEDKIDGDIIKGKVVFSTFHQVKGLERKVSMVYNFDKSYFDYFKKDQPMNRCPNELYVAITRAKEKMTLFHHYKHPTLPFLDINELRKVVDFKKECDIMVSIKPRSESKNFAVTDMIKHLPPDVVANLMSYIKIEQITEPQDEINIDIKTEQGELYENVSEITGTAIVSYFEYYRRRKMAIHDHLCQVHDILPSDYVPTAPSGYMFVDTVEADEPIKPIKQAEPIVPDDSDDEELDAEADTDESIEYQRGYAFIDNTVDILNITYTDENHDYLYDISALPPSKLLKISNKYCAYMTGYSYKLHQIIQYNWLTVDHLRECINRLKPMISSCATFETIVRYTNDELKNHNKILLGSIDCKAISTPLFNPASAKIF